MFLLIHHLYNAFDRFQDWFDQRYGWFFTNGMKKPRPRRHGMFRA